MFYLRCKKKLLNSSKPAAPFVSHSQHHDEREEGGCLPDCDHVLVQLSTPWIGDGRESNAAVTLPHFDQDNEQSCTDNGKKDGQNSSSRGGHLDNERWRNEGTEDKRRGLFGD
jgi:hypothetical protein